MTDTLFISHASEDGPQVARIVDYLEARGVPCWISSRDIPPKSIYAEVITEAMRSAGACAVIVSEAANASAAIKRELELASRSNKPFIPIRIDATEPGPGLDYYLNNTPWMDFRREGFAALDRIVAHMKGGPPPPMRAAPAPERRASGPGAAIAIGLLAIALVAGGGWFAWTQFGGGGTQQAAPPPSELEIAPAVQAEAAPAPAPAIPAIVGVWNGVSRMDGAPPGVEGSLPDFVFSADGSWRGVIGGDVTGQWRDDNGVITWDCGAQCWHFIGRIEADGVFRGRMNSNNPGVPNASFEMRRTAP